MKKNIISLAVLAYFFAPVSLAEGMDESFKGSRIGVGFSSTVEEYRNSYIETGTGLHLEYGYDFNKVASFIASYDSVSGDHSSYSIKGSAIKVGLDLGYAFVFNSWVLKPYGSVGLAFGDAEWTTRRNQISTSETSPYVGLGIRAHLKDGLYFDLKSNVAEFNGYAVGQGSVSVGFKF